MTKNKIVFFLGLGIPAFFVFKSLILLGPAVWGDAPYFYLEGLKELVAEPFAWSSRGNNFGGPNNLLWISPVMLIYGLLNKLFGLDNDAVTRILFYFPSITLAFIAPIILVKKLGYSQVVQFFASLLYGLNTYFLLLIDGGQVGVALAYGLFPLALIFVRSLLSKPTFLGFFLALFFLFLTTIADPRFAAIGVFTVLLWVGVEWFAFRKTDEIKNLKFSVPLLFATILLCAYWLIPAFRVGETALATDVSGLNFLSLLNSLLLFQPHWPQNEFGKILSPPFYFALLPLLLFGGLLVKKEKRSLVFAFCFLLFAFLVKGGSEPFGAWYNWLVSNTPFGFAFRDSSKFFAPLILFAGILIGLTAESLRKGGRYRIAFVGVIFIYLLFLVHPALLGNLNGALSGRGFTEDFNLIYRKLRDDPQFFRTAWFPERHPFAFFIQDKPALDAKLLMETRPFASMNVGTLDVFNFLHNKNAIDWFNLLGVKYLIFSGDARTNASSKEEIKNLDDLLSLVRGNEGLEKTDWGVQFPVFKVPETKPHIFSVGRLITVVGGDDIYQKLKDADSNFSIGNQGFVFFEDGKFNPRSLQTVASESVALVLNGKDKTDLAMSFLQEYFVGPSGSEFSQWAVREETDYLRYKYELLINGVDTKEFDYGKGIAFSSIKGEKISWDLDVPLDGDYILAVRILQDDGFSWDISDVKLAKGVYPLTLINDTGLKAVNVVALIPRKDWEESLKLADELADRFGIVMLEDESGATELTRLLADTRWQEIPYEMASPVRYKIDIPEGANWLIFSDSYNKGWILERGPIGLPAYPFYSMVNGFYPRPEWREAEIVFEGQKDIRRGIFLSTLSFLSLVIIFLWFYSKAKDAN